ncbi:hypothetical protein [Gallaecimonas mangrovi]|uniref:hypothetical protein n=1 Tax=Gallaecimonas mangrovi TaxID=2291597 RepID=UPI000E209C04|nr:hypothetical protein [Gallaecimonas mangrovi]
MKRAIVTLAIGEKYINLFNNHCRSNWLLYTKKYDIDLIVIESPIDTSDIAKNRSPAWQKCLILKDERVKNYDQVAWVDSDILINPNSPNIFEFVKEDEIGAVDGYSVPDRENHIRILEDRYKYWESINLPYIENLHPHEYHNVFGLPDKFDYVVQTGVIVLSPKYHADILEYVYYNYEDKGGPEWNYEMRPLSYELQKNCNIKWLNYKFNATWDSIKNTYFPFLRENKKSILMKLISRIPFTISLFKNEKLTKKCMFSTYESVYFFHFAGCADKMKFFDEYEHKL